MFAGPIDDDVLWYYYFIIHQYPLLEFRDSHKVNNAWPLSI